MEHSDYVLYYVWDLLCITSFILEPQERFWEERKIYRYHTVQYYVSFLTYECCYYFITLL